MYTLLNNAPSKGYIQGLGKKDDFPDRVNLYFVDDTLLFLEAKSQFIKALK
jgi:hypothetical protein